MPPLIAIDGRGLFQKNPTGVANAFSHIYSHLKKLEPKLSYLIWDNQFKKTYPTEMTSILNTRYPNKLLHGWWNFSPWPNVNKIINWRGMNEPRAWWLPNIAQIRLQPQNRYLLTLHDLSFILNPSWYPLRKQLWHKLLRLKTLLKKATYIVCVSNEVKQSALELFKLSEKKLFVGHLASTSPVIPAQAGIHSQQPITYNLKPTPYFLHLSSRLPRKNTDGVISAYKIYHQLSASPQDLILIGDYKLKEKISGVKILPYQTEENLAELYTQATALLYPSWYEGFGLPIIEAQNHNCPVIASSIGSLPEIGDDSVLYTAPWDTTGLAKLMIELENNPELVKKLKADGQKNLARFSWVKTAQLYNYLFWEMTK